MKARLVLNRKFVLRAGPGSFYNLPGIARRRGGVNDDRARRAETCGDFILVGPAPVIQTAFARKQIRIPFGVIVQHDEHLAAHVLELVVVPLILRRLDAKAHEHEFGVRE